MLTAAERWRPRRSTPSCGGPSATTTSRSCTPRWVRQRYDCGCYPSLAPARQAAVRTAWHEAGHAVAALAVGARFSSASIHHGHRSEGRVHGVTGAHEDAFVIDAAGQIAERLMNWTMLDTRRRAARLAAHLAAGWRRRPPVPAVDRRALRQRRGRRLALLRGHPDPAAAGDPAGGQGPARPSAAPALQRGGRSTAVKGSVKLSGETDRSPVLTSVMPYSAHACRDLV